MKKIFFSTLLALLLGLLLMLPCFAEYDKQLVYDLADLLSAEEEAEIQLRAASLSEEQQADIVILTADDTGGKSAMEYADDFYDEMKIGYGAEYGPGVLFLIDMDNREAWISTGGDTESRVIDAFTDSEIERVLDEVYPYLSEEDYHAACLAFISSAEGTLNGSDTSDYYIGGYDYDDYYGSELPVDGFLRQAGRPWYKQLRIWPVIVGVIVAAIVVMRMRKKSAGVMTAGAANYENIRQRRVLEQKDTVVNVAHNTRKLPRNDPSSGTRGGFSGGGIHTSSGGHIHGGGGRKF